MAIFQKSRIIMYVKFKEYCLKFKFPVNYFGTLLSEKAGIEVSCIYNNELLYADIPLVDTLSSENKDRYCSAISNFIKSLKEIEDIQALFENSSKLDLPNNFLFGLNSLVLSIYLQNFDFSTECLVKSYSFFSDISQISEDKLSNSESIKIKFNGSREECNHINKLYESLGIRFRLDFNRKFDLQRCLSLLDMLNINAIKYIEEPCNTPEDTLILHSLSSVPIALDETLINRELNDDLLNISNYFIIKPSIIGDYKYIDFLITTAKSNTISVVFSSAYESHIGINAIKDLVRYYELQDEAMGLDTEKLIHSISYTKA